MFDLNARTLLAIMLFTMCAIRALGVVAWALNRVVA